MNFLDNFLSSGHSFSKEENLIKFRFSLLNSILIIAAFYSFELSCGQVWFYTPI